MRFHTNFKYTSRKDKPEYVWRKYKEILRGRILDVGADECGLKKFLPEGSEYIGIGLGGSVDLEIDLEKNRTPYDDNSFDCVLCLDVLEHLDNIHKVFDELCRITKKYLIISLPNPWVTFMDMLRRGYYKHTEFPMKFYNLPIKPQNDRHKWFYGMHEAERFIVERGKMNNMVVIQLDRESSRGLKSRIYRAILKFIVHKDLDVDSLIDSRLWAVLIKKSN